MIKIKPTDTRFVDIHHGDWKLDWAIQFPEAISSLRGFSMSWEPIHPDWERRGDNAWGYEWRTTEEYIQGVRTVCPPGFVVGLALDAEIAGGDGEVSLSLTITNETDEPFEEVRSDGGCFQARSDTFRDDEEVARSHVVVDGRMTTMSKIHRSLPIRTCYRAANDRETPIGAPDFWGESNALIDVPAILGAVSADGSHAVVMGYENATRALQNADEGHHCLHSYPLFGTIGPGESATRRGYILFGEDVQSLADALRPRL